MFVYQFDTNTKVCDVLPLQRNNQIKSTSNALQQARRFCVWQLLNFALLQTVGKGVEQCDLQLNGNGKWTSSLARFSLSHTDDVVAVAVSGVDVGVDVERLRKAFTSQLAHRVLTQEERDAYDDLPSAQQREYLLEQWTKKEAIFKMLDGQIATVSKVQTSNYHAQNCQLALGKVNYVFAVSALRPVKVCCHVVKRVNGKLCF